MKNKITDLNNHFFAQMERLSDEDLTAEDLKKEIKRTQSIVSLGNTIINNFKVMIDVAKISCDFEKRNINFPKELKE